MIIIIRLIAYTGANSAKHPERQPVVVSDVAEQVSGPNRAIVGTMIESFLLAGRQELRTGEPLVYGQSITDGCIDWNTTTEVLTSLAQAVRARRAACGSPS